MIADGLFQDFPCDQLFGMHNAPGMAAMVWFGTGHRYSERAQQKIEAWRVDYNEHLFESIQYAQQTATEWLWRYNAERSNMASGGMIPYQKMANAA